MEKVISETNFKKAKKWKGGSSLDDDLLLLDDVKNAPFPYDPLRMNFIIIGVCTKGHAEYRVDTLEHVINSGDMLIVSERHVVDHYVPSDDLEGLVLMISMNFFNEIICSISDVSSMFLFSRFHPVFTISQRDRELFKQYFYVIRKKMQEKGNHYRRDLVRTLMLAMFYDLSDIVYRFRLTDTKLKSRSDAIFARFIKLVEENCKVERRVKWYAEQLDVSPKYLSETVKQASLRTPNEWIDNYVMLAIRVQLKNSSKNVKDIARELNFPNQSFLGKYFKLHAGVSPREYRKM